MMTFTFYLNIFHILKFLEILGEIKRELFLEIMIRSKLGSNIWIIFNLKWKILNIMYVAKIGSIFDLNSYTGRGVVEGISDYFIVI